MGRHGGAPPVSCATEMEHERPWRGIILSCRSRSGDCARAAGFDDHLMKPVEWLELKRALAGLLSTETER